MAEDTANINLSHQWLVLDTIRKMRDADAAGRREEYVKEFEYATQLVISYIPKSVRIKLDQDFVELWAAIDQVKEKDSNEQSQKKEILNLKEDFANRHRVIPMLALSKLGIIKVTEEGVLDFAKIDLETTANIIRAGGGLPSSVERVTARGEAKKEGPS